MNGAWPFEERDNEDSVGHGLRTIRTTKKEFSTDVVGVPAMVVSIESQTVYVFWRWPVPID